MRNYRLEFTLFNYEQLISLIGLGKEGTISRPAGSVLTPEDSIQSVYQIEFILCDIQNKKQRLSERKIPGESKVFPALSQGL